MKDAMSKRGGIRPECPKCGGVIPSHDVNVAQNVAYCRPCNIANKLSVLMHNADLMDGVDFHQPPSGIQYDTMGDKFTIRATHRSFGTAAGTLAVALFWNGIVSIFVLLALSSTLSLLGIPVPHWFPAPEMNDDTMGLGTTLFFWIFLTPFIVIGSIMIGAFLLSVWGRTEIQIDRGEGLVFTGVGPLGYRQRFLTSQVSDVRIADKQWTDSDGGQQRKTNIVIETHEGKLIRFGSTLSEERRKFAAALLRKALVR